MILLNVNIDRCFSCFSQLGFTWLFSSSYQAPNFERLIGSEILQLAVGMSRAQRWMWDTYDILTWPMAKLESFWDYIFISRDNKVQAFISGSIV